MIGPPPPLLTRPRLLLALAGAAALVAALLPEAADQPSLAGARFAYIDPGAGSFVFQALVALLAAGWRGRARLLEDDQGVLRSDDTR